MPDRLQARTVRLTHPVDLHAVAGAGTDGWLFHRSGIGLAGRGVTRRGPADQISTALAAARVEDEVSEPGSGPVAFGARPFLPGAPFELVIPALVVFCGPGGAWWVTTVADEGAALPDPERALSELLSAEARREPATPPTPDSVALTDEPDTDTWCAAVAAATTRIGAGELEKVVLSRVVEARADTPFPLDAVLARLRDGFEGSYVFSVDQMVGATPELLVERAGDVVRSQPMAGSTPLHGDPAADDRAVAALAASRTYRHEHQVTIDVVHDTLLAYCSYLDDEPEPSVVRLPNVAHLATTVEGRLSHPPASVLELSRALHPTPAVCGRPRDAALAVIADLEPAPRGRYAGAVGWVDGHGNGTWAVTLRCAQLDGAVARLHAGCGLVADSDPATELVESTAKLQVMLHALLGPSAT